MSSVAVQIWPEEQRALSFAGIGAAYMGIGTALSEPSVLFEVYNLTNAALQFSLDGVTDHFVLPSGGASIRDFSSNKGKGDSLSLSADTRVYAKQVGSPPTSGSVYVVSWYRNTGQ